MGTDSVDLRKLSRHNWSTAAVLKKTMGVPGIEPLQIKKGPTLHNMKLEPGTHLTAAGYKLSFHPNICIQLTTIYDNKQELNSEHYMD